MEQKTCLLFGECINELGAIERLNTAVIKNAQVLKVQRFVVGPGTEFDRHAAQAVRAARLLMPDLTLARLHPAAGWDDMPLDFGFDDEIFPDAKPVRGRTYNLVKAAQAVLTQADCLILYAPFPTGRVRALVREAHRLAERGRLCICDISFPV